MLWEADASRPTEQEWSNFATHDLCTEEAAPEVRTPRIRQVRAPRGAPTARAYRFALRPGDRCYGDARAELAQGNPGRPMPDGVDREFREGQRVWVSFWVRFADGYPLRRWDRDAFHSLVQFKQAGPGSPPLNLGLEDGAFAVGRTGGRASWRDWPDAVRFGAPRPRAVYRFSFHVRFSARREEGFVEVFADLADGAGMRRVVARVRDRTLAVAHGRVLASHLRIGPYRSARLARTTTVSHYGGITVATTRRAAEREAFSGR